MTNFMLYGSLGAMGAPVDTTLLTISRSTVAMVGILATLATVGLLLAGMVVQRRRTRRNQTAVTMTTGWAGANA